jgi:hypothetical protein
MPVWRTDKMSMFQKGDPQITQIPQIGKMIWQDGRFTEPIRAGLAFAGD